MVDEVSIGIAKTYDGIADILLLDSHKPGDAQIGALGVTHNWELDKAIIASVSIPVIIAGGLGPDNVTDAIKATRPLGVDLKPKQIKTMRVIRRTWKKFGFLSSELSLSNCDVNPEPAV